MNFSTAKTAIASMSNTTLLNTQITSEEAKVMSVINALSNRDYTWRTLEGVAEDCELSTDDVAAIIFALIDSGKVSTKKLLNSAGKKMYKVIGHRKAEILPALPDEVQIDMDEVDEVELQRISDEYDTEQNEMDEMDN